MRSEGSIVRACIIIWPAFSFARGHYRGGDSQRKRRSASMIDSKQLEKGLFVRCSKRVDMQNECVQERDRRSNRRGDTDRVCRSNTGHDVAKHSSAVHEGVPQSGARRKVTLFMLSASGPPWMVRPHHLAHPRLCSRKSASRAFHVPVDNERGQAHLQHTGTQPPTCVGRQRHRLRGHTEQRAKGGRPRTASRGARSIHRAPASLPASPSISTTAGAGPAT